MEKNGPSAVTSTARMEAGNCGLSRKDGAALGALQREGPRPSARCWCWGLERLAPVMAAEGWEASGSQCPGLNQTGPGISTHLQVGELVFEATPHSCPSLRFQLLSLEGAKPWADRGLRGGSAHAAKHHLCQAFR